MNVAGKKVRVRDRKTSDSVMEIVWGQDEEVVVLDPPAGKILNIQLFSIETLDGKHIGLCSLYNQTLTDVQFGIRIGDKDYWNGGYGTDAVRVLVNYCFATMDVERIWLKVLPWNFRAIKCYKRCKFVRTGWLALDGHNFVVMERRRDNDH